jgi:hypothetical protein
MALGSGIRDPGSGKNLFLDPGSRGQKGIGFRIRNTAQVHLPKKQHTKMGLQKGTENR